jgi:tetratricopeptide (TPR) repeat protein
VSFDGSRNRSSASVLAHNVDLGTQMIKKQRSGATAKQPVLPWQPQQASPLQQVDVASVFGQALAFHRAGQLAEAERLYRRILQVERRHFDSLHLLGVIHFQRGEFSEAVRQIDDALKIDPNVADAHNNRANALKKLKRPEQALASYDRAIALKPDDAATFNNRGAVLKELERFEEALADLDQAIMLRPDFAEAFNNRGNVYRELEQFGEALSDYDKALALHVKNPDALNNRGAVLNKLERYDEALADLDKAIALKPDHAEAHYNRGTTLVDLRRPDEALADFGRAIALRPDYAQAFYSRGTAYLALARIDEALADFDRAIGFKSDHQNALWNRAVGRLLTGRYREGWPEYEWRLQVDPTASSRRDFRRPRWTGSRDIAGKTLLLHHEQGFGDTIMAARYVRRLIESGTRVVIDAPAPLASLLAQIDGANVVTTGDASPSFDFHCPMMSLPLAFATRLETIPADVPYLSAPPAHIQKWAQRLPRSGVPRVGIAWAGNPTYKQDRIRTIGLPRVLPLLSRTDVHYVGLQRDLRDGDAELLRGHPQVENLGDALETFADTAAVIASLDLIISIDSATVHLAGALGKPVWILLPYSPDWRWLLGRDDSPWYPTARLFRQTRFDDWSGAVERATEELARFAQSFRA